jgi:hypothetical protein
MAHSNGLAGSLYWTKWLSTIGILNFTPEQKQAYFRERISYITINVELGLVIDVVYKKDLIEKNLKKKKNT